MYGERKAQRKAVVPFMRSRSRCQCDRVILINRISAEAVTWLLLYGGVCVINALLM